MMRKCVSARERDRERERERRRRRRVHKNNLQQLSHLHLDVSLDIECIERKRGCSKHKNNFLVVKLKKWHLMPAVAAQVAEQ